MQRIVRIPSIGFVVSPLTHLAKLGLLLVLLAAWPVSAQVAKQKDSEFDRATFVHPRLTPVKVVDPLDAVKAQMRPDVVASWTSFVTSTRGEWVAQVDPRSGFANLVTGSGVPWIPGNGNSLTNADIAGYLGALAAPDLSTLEAITRAYLPKVAALLGVSGADLVLNQGRSGHVADHLWTVDFDLMTGGLPVDGARVFFNLNAGNLVAFGGKKVPPLEKGPPAFFVPRYAALDKVSTSVGGLTDATDRLVDPGSTHLIVMTPRSDMDVSTYTFGKGYELAAVWQFVLKRKGVMGTWQARVDATTGELLEFKDVNDYAQVTGGVYPISYIFADETVMNMPFIDVTPPAGTYTNSGGLYTYTSGTVTSTMNGKYVKLSDTCGSISLSTSAAPGNIAFGMSSGTDCATPGVGGAGNTHSSREQFYQIGRLNEKGRGYLPANSWLQNQVTVNVNLNQTCNAYWDGSALNFFRSGGGCGNTGEISDVSDHEWGHGMDQNDGNGSSPDYGTGEHYGDWTAVLQSHASCAGAGFQGGNCGGYGNACTACTGVRDIDYAKHTSPTPATPAGFNMVNCIVRPCTGPCGRECHCESAPVSQATWDMVVRDFTAPPLNMSTSAAWTLADRLWYTTRPTAGSAFTCVAAGGKGGCAAGTEYQVYLIADDDDGNLANGTPHACAIYAAFNRHDIACGLVSDAKNSCTSGCATPASPVITAIAANNQVSLSWAATSGVYDVYRNEAGCSNGFTPIATNLAATAYTDNAVANGTTYYYQVVAHVSGNPACASAPSNCATATPTPCTTPGTPTIGTASVTGLNQITVTFSAGVPVPDTYNVYSAIGTCAAPGAYTRIGTGVAGSPYVDNTVSGGTTYAYRVTAVDATGLCESAQSGCAEATATGSCTLPPTFAGVTSVTNGATATCTLGLTWSAATPRCGGPVTYNVYRSTTAGFTPAPANMIVAGLVGTSFSDTGGLVSGTTYEYVVRAVDTANGVEDTNLVRLSGKVTGAVSAVTVTETFEGALSGGGFDNAGWTKSALSGATNWVWSTAQSQTPTHSWFSAEQTSATDRVLVTPTFGVLAGTTLSFWHTYAFEGSVANCYDAGTLEISTDAGGTWNVLPDAAFTLGGFNGTVNSSWQNPIAGKRAWCSGTIGAMTHVTANLGAYVGANAMLRWHEGDDNGLNVTGWYVDSVTLTGTGVAASCATASGATATVTGGGTICLGASTSIQAVLTGTPPWNVTWSDTVTQSGVLTSPLTRTVSPSSTTTYSVTAVADSLGAGTASGSALVTVNPDVTAPVVTPPAGVTLDETLCCGTFGGVTSATSATLATFLAGGSATDDCTATPTALPPQVGGVDVTSATCFEGVTAVTFRFQDAALIVGTATANVTVRMFGDLNLDGVINATDVVLLRGYLNLAISPGTVPFVAPLNIADVFHDASVDATDMVVLRSYLSLAVSCLAP